MSIKEIISKRKNFTNGTKITNCVSHMGLSITDRPEDCHLCYLDMKNFINRVLYVNHFLNNLLDEMEKEER